MKTKKKSKKIIIIIIAVIAVIVLAAGIGLVRLASSLNVGAMVSTAKPERGDLQESITTSGTVKSGEVMVVFSEVNAKVAEVQVAAGDAVKNGDLLLAFDMESEEQDLRMSALELAKSNAGYYGAMADHSEGQADLREADTNLAVLERQIADNKAYLKRLQEDLNQDRRENGNDFAEEEYELSKKLTELENMSKEGVSVSAGDASWEEQISDINAKLARNRYLQSIANSTDYVAEMEQEIADVQELIADYEAYKAEMEGQKNSGEAMVMDTYDKQQYEADREMADISYKKAEQEYYMAKQGVLASFDGIISECSVIEGSTISEGMQLLTLESTESVKVTFDASKYDVEKLEVGQKVDITIMKNEYQGKIKKINRMTTLNASNTPMVGVEVEISNPDEKIILGMDAKLKIYTAKAENALLIPVEAVNADKEGDFLYVVEDGVAVRRPVVCGVATDTQIEILEGVTEEDDIIVTSLTLLEEGMKVTVLPEIPEM